MVKNQDVQKVKCSNFQKGNKWKCTECSATFRSKSNMERHVSSVHKGIKHKCPDCDAEYAQKGALKNHIKKVHEGIKVFLNLEIKTDNS